MAPSPSPSPSPSPNHSPNPPPPENSPTSPSPTPSTSTTPEPTPLPKPNIKRPLDVPTKPAAKRSKSSEPKSRPPNWIETIREAWNILCTRFPGRISFKNSEIINIVDAEWTQLRPDAQKNSQWKKELSKVIRRERVLTRDPDADKSGFYIMNNPNNVPSPPQKFPRKRDVPDVEHSKLHPDDNYRAVIPPEWTMQPYKPVCLSPFDKSASITFVGSRELNIVKGHKGYRMIRASTSVCEGDWYFEACILPCKEGAVRLGWSQRRADVETPVGFDTYGFGIRDRTGEFIHAARLKPYGPSFGVGDVIGCRISLPKLTDDQKKKVVEADHKWLEHRFLHFLQGPTPPDSGIDLLPDASIRFYKNGDCMGIPTFFTEPRSVAVERQKDPAQLCKPNVDLSPKDLPQQPTAKRSTTALKREFKAAFYYPSIALYGDAVVEANFGPKFEYPLPEGCEAMCEAACKAPVVTPDEPTLNVVNTSAPIAPDVACVPPNVPSLDAPSPKAPPEDVNPVDTLPIEPSGTVTLSTSKGPAIAAPAVSTNAPGMPFSILTTNELLDATKEAARDVENEVGTSSEQNPQRGAVIKAI